MSAPTTNGRNSKVRTWKFQLRIVLGPDRKVETELLDVPDGYSSTRLIGLWEPSKWKMIFGALDARANGESSKILVQLAGKNSGQAIHSLIDEKIIDEEILKAIENLAQKADSESEGFSVLNEEVTGSVIWQVEDMKRKSEQRWTERIQPQEELAEVMERIAELDRMIAHVLQEPRAKAKEIIEQLNRRRSNLLEDDLELAVFTFGSQDANEKVADALTEKLIRAGLCLKCPECSAPSEIRILKNQPRYPHGIFRFVHVEDKSTVHKRVDWPELQLVDLPALAAQQLIALKFPRKDPSTQRGV